MQLLMKERNTGERWTRKELREIRSHLRTMCKLVPALVVFLLPGGLFFLPVLAEALDRRRGIRVTAAQHPPQPPA